MCTRSGCPSYHPYCSYRSCICSTNLSTGHDGTPFHYHRLRTSTYWYPDPF